MQEKESIMGHRLEIGGASVLPGPAIPRVENSDLKMMPIIDSHILSPQLNCLSQIIISHVDHTVNPAVNSSSPKRLNSAT